MKLSFAKGGFGRGWLMAALAAAAGAGLIGGAASMQTAAPRPPAYLANFPNFAPRVTAQLPGDVDIALKKRLEAAKKFSEVQREFDLYSWQMFLALNWPTNDQGRPAPRITDTAFGAPGWSLWHASSDIFRHDGARPAACGLPAQARALTVRRDLSVPVSRGLRPFSAAAAATDHRRTRFLGVLSAVGELNAANLGDDIQQAFSGPLIDQNGEFVFYEILIDPNEVSYLCANALYNINGQVAFSQAGGKVVMPIGAPNIDRSGAFELKLAWRILKPGKDDFTRYHTMPAVVMDPGPNGTQNERKVTVGLVGMHIGHKSTTSPQWIWSTFEQVDNVDVDQVAHPNLNPSFFDPNCWICAVNQEPQKVNGAYPRTPVQAWRAIGIPKDKQALNAQAQAALRRLGSVWQYYQLIDTQWPTSPGTPPSAWDSGLPGSVENKPGGAPTPVFLTNITMETYFQGGHVDPPGIQTNQMNGAACNAQEAVPDSVDCETSASAQPPVWTSPLENQGTQMKPGVKTLIFATESCMGCHSSAGVYTSYDNKGRPVAGGQLTGDFSWLLTQKASAAGGAQSSEPLDRARRRSRR